MNAGFSQILDTVRYIFTFETAGFPLNLSFTQKNAKFFPKSKIKKSIFSTMAYTI
jgi:hypothetical protein